MKVSVFTTLVFIALLACSNTDDPVNTQAQTQPEPVTVAVSKDLEPMVLESVEKVQKLQAELQEANNELSTLIKIIKSSKQVEESLQFAGFSRAQDGTINALFVKNE